MSKGLKAFLVFLGVGFLLFAALGVGAFLFVHAGSTATPLPGLAPADTVVAPPSALPDRTALALPFAPVPTVLPADPDAGTLRCAELGSLLRRRRFEDLTAYLEMLDHNAVDADADTNAEADAEARRRLPLALDAFETADPTLEPLLDAWVEAKPRSFVPHIARAHHHFAVGLQLRTTTTIDQVSPAQLEGMRTAFDHARRDLRRASERREGLVDAEVLEMWMTMALGDEAGNSAAYERAIRACPSCTEPVWARLVALEPKWGGSYALMEAEIARARARAQDSEDMAAFVGVPDEARCEETLVDGDHEGALALCARALARGRRPSALLAHARVLRAMERWQEALADADEVLEAAPDDARALEARFLALYALDRDEEAARTFFALARCDPSSPFVRDRRDAAAQVASLAGWAHYEAGRRRPALELYEIAMLLDPEDRDHAEREQTIVLDESDRHSVDELRARVEASPDDFFTVRDLDWALSRENRFAEILPHWDTYLAAHPEDARAHLERAGTLFHLGRADDEHADLARACELGLATACRRLGR